MGVAETNVSATAAGCLAEVDREMQLPMEDGRGGLDGGSVAVAADRDVVGVDEGGGVAVVVPDRST